jgi:thioesterase domain-containing protein
VIQRSTTRFALPIPGDFTAAASTPEAEAWDSFARTLERKGRARITVAAVLEHDGKAVCHFEGDFVALGGNR